MRSDGHGEFEVYTQRVRVVNIRVSVISNICTSHG